MKLQEYSLQKIINTFPQVIIIEKDELPDSPQNRLKPLDLSQKKPS